MVRGSDWATSVSAPGPDTEPWVLGVPEHASTPDGRWEHISRGVWIAMVGSIREP